MSLKIDAGRSATAYHVSSGAVVFPYAIDAHHAVARHPDEWSWDPWGENGEKVKPVVEIPEGWEELSAAQRIALAVKLGAERKGMTAAKADDMILAEVSRRETVSPEQPE